jgi:hypothetical protein
LQSKCGSTASRIRTDCWSASTLFTIM